MLICSSTTALPWIQVSYVPTYMYILPIIWAKVLIDHFWALPKVINQYFTSAVTCRQDMYVCITNSCIWCVGE